MEKITKLDHKRADLNLKKLEETLDVKLFMILESARRKRFKKHYNEKIQEILDSKDNK